MYSQVSILILPLLQVVLSQQTDKYTDENRPYKFGFNIDGYQHRKEEKNEKGIIEGEYGFITADGYYRVTKYKTDENGKFKIISQKNYYVGFPPENPTTTPSVFQQSFQPENVKPEQVKRRPFPEKIEHIDVSDEEPPASSTTAKPDRKTALYSTPTTSRSNLFQGQPACSHCIIPTTKKPTKSNISNQISVDYRVGSLFETTTVKVRNKYTEIVTTGKQNLSEKQAFRKNNLISKYRSNIPENKVNRNEKYIESDVNGFKKNNNFPRADSNLGDLNLNVRDEKNLPKIQDLFGVKNFFKSFGETEKPNLVDKLKQISRDKPRIDISRNSIKDEESVRAKNKLLYTFNYTLGFHGHHENGFKNGNKEGDYFFDSKDGTKRNVTYIANEFGYQPNITLTDLNENEKRQLDENNENDHGLKGYEFRWFYTRRK